MLSFFTSADRAVSSDQLVLLLLLVSRCHKMSQDVPSLLETLIILSR